MPQYLWFQVRSINGCLKVWWETIFGVVWSILQVRKLNNVKMKDNNFKTEKIWQILEHEISLHFTNRGTYWHQIPSNDTAIRYHLSGSNTLRGTHVIFCRVFFTKNTQLEFKRKSFTHDKTVFKIARKLISKVSASWKSKNACVTCHSLERTEEMLMLDQKKDISVTSLAVWVRSVVLYLVLMIVLWWYNIFTLGWRQELYTVLQFFESLKLFQNKIKDTSSEKNHE